jgi:carbonic anhydrase
MFFFFLFHRFALELHMVHHDKRYETLSKAAESKNGIAVLGILFHITETPNPMIEKLLVNSATIFEFAGKNITYREKLILTDFLPLKLDSFFRYDGSLTTPGCGEAVVWTVFERSIGISNDQLERFKGVHDAEGHELTHNYRHIQPLNSRNLIYVQGSQENSGAFSQTFSISLIIFATIITGFLSSAF